MWIRHRTIIACIAPGLLGTTGSAQTSSDSALIRSTRSFVDSAGFSGVVLVAKNGVPILELARGDANRRRSIANAMTTRFQLASGDKWFTKVAISQLVAAGKVALTDTVGTFLPGYPNATVRSKATVQHLLMHRSGMGMYWNDAFSAKRKDLNTLDDVVPLFAGEQLAFAPGERMQYSNNGYIILGRIIEVASGMSYYDYVQRHVFMPAGMSQTAYLTLDEWPADKAVGYASGAENTSSLAFRGSSAGGGYSTARDLLRLDAALRKGAIGDSAVLARITARGPGGRMMIANGGGEGANVEISRFGDYTVIVLANLDPPAATQVLQHAGSFLQTPAPPR
jgi:CubicO group peptidase (beta-lactamase class C family)